MQEDPLPPPIRTTRVRQTYWPALRSISCFSKGTANYKLASRARCPGIKIGIARFLCGHLEIRIDKPLLCSLAKIRKPVRDVLIMSEEETEPIVALQDAKVPLGWGLFGLCINSGSNAQTTIIICFTRHYLKAFQGYSTETDADVKRVRLAAEKMFKHKILETLAHEARHATQREHKYFDAILKPFEWLYSKITKKLMRFAIALYFSIISARVLMRFLMPGDMNTFAIAALSAIPVMVFLLGIILMGLGHHFHSANRRERDAQKFGKKMSTDPRWQGVVDIRMRHIPTGYLA